LVTSSELESLHKKLWSHIDEEKKSWSSFVYAQEKGFYQGFDEINIDGCRPTEKRLERYKINEYFSSNKKALDIGCNCGFFTLHVSKFLKSIDGVELNPFLIKIADDTKKFLNNENSNFHNSSFEDFQTEKTFDIIFSLANDETIDGNTKFTFQQYVEKINSLLNSSGMLMWETVSPDTFEPERFKPKLEILQKYYEIIDDKMVKSEYPVNVPQRRFLIFKKLD